MSDSIKSSLYNACMAYVNQRIDWSRSSMQDAQQAANEESKSTAGDKHDTSRAMMQIAVEQAAVKLADAEKMKEDLLRVDWNHSSEKILAGSIVRTDNANFFIAIPAGKIETSAGLFFAISISSPVAQAMKGLQKGDSYALNGNLIRILDVY